MDLDDPRARRTRRRILDAAIESLGRTGIAHASMDGIAVAAGVSRSTLYRHFASFGEVLRAALDELAPESPQLDGPPIERIRVHVGGLGAALRGGAWGDLAASIIERAERDDDVRALHTDFTHRRRAPLVAAIREAVADGELPTGTDPDTLTTALTAPLYYHRLVLHAPLGRAAVDRLVDDTLTRFAC